MKNETMQLVLNFEIFKIFKNKMQEKEKNNCNIILLFISHFKRSGNYLAHNLIKYVVFLNLINHVAFLKLWSRTTILVAVVFAISLNHTCG